MLVLKSQTRMEQSADNEGEEEMDEVEEYTEKQRQALKRNKTAVSGEGGGGGGGSGCGPGGGGRQPVKGTEILHKSSKEFYRAVAKQWGITCKMSDHCRCLDCQVWNFTV